MKVNSKIASFYAITSPFSSLLNQNFKLDFICQKKLPKKTFLDYR